LWGAAAVVLSISNLYSFVHNAGNFKYVGLKSQICNIVVVKKEPTYIPAICLENLRETMEADNSKLPNAKE
jgi:hypothetical protein